MGEPVEGTRNGALSGSFSAVGDENVPERSGGPRDRVISELADEVLGVERVHPVRVGVDGSSAAGKTTLADELAGVLRKPSGREVIRAEFD